MGNTLYAVVESDVHGKLNDEDGLDGLNDQSDISEQSDIGKHI